ncbi:acid-soluble spore protein N [Fervidibacillus albus]|uniref:Small, acid-soluble spore protein N n=1 Tax=Fervidibacillus albus TaxID=2980026 RepID=A0A9E8LWL0_9BACI|nr:acid-soluble spore protein N [Fervidibacillus albus]WAA10896.1 acid-soluble spore protein N [Fervidibacillus albus]
MSNPKKDTKHFRPDHLGMDSKSAGGNKGKQMQTKSKRQVDVIQTKGE